MKLLTIEPTPSPNAMKLNLDEALPSGLKYAYDSEHAALAPAHLRALLEIEGVKSVYHAADFIALEREASADWRAVLAAVREAFGAAGTGGAGDAAAAAGGAFAYGEAHVLVQMFRGI
ncbi:MAG TPA: NifU N-terminal domain-containing protein, partial [Paenibacillus sp.]|nr:NifU N-terminal domain-containing protein [Paenibacillus sp.]